MKRFHIFLEGEVQGITLRYHARKFANSLGLNGWVKNLEDGRVESVVEGDDEAVNKLIVWFEKGPYSSGVEKIVAKEEKLRGEHSSFEIEY